jgi:hypothetical protein
VNFLGGGPGRVERLAEHRPERDALERQAQPAANHRGDVDEVLDEAGLRAGVARDDVHRPAALGVAELGALQDGRPPQDRVERGAQLVREDGEELVLARARHLDVPQRLQRALPVREDLAGQPFEVPAGTAGRFEPERVAQPLHAHVVHRPGPELLRRERLDHVVLRAFPQERRTRRIVGRGRQDQDRDTVEMGKLPDGEDHPRAAHARERRRHDDQVESRLRRLLEAGPAVGGRDDRERACERLRDELCRGGIVVDDQRSRPGIDGHAGRSLAGERAARYGVGNCHRTVTAPPYQRSRGRAIGNTCRVKTFTLLRASVRCRRRAPSRRRPRCRPGCRPPRA